MWCNNSETNNLVFKLTENRIHMNVFFFSRNPLRSLTNEIAVWWCGFNRTRKNKINKECYRTTATKFCCCFSVIDSSARVFFNDHLNCNFCVRVFHFIWIAMDFFSVWWRADKNLVLLKIVVIFFLRIDNECIDACCVNVGKKNIRNLFKNKQKRWIKKK